MIRQSELGCDEVRLSTNLSRSCCRSLDVLESASCSFAKVIFELGIRGTLDALLHVSITAVDTLQSGATEIEAASILAPK